MPFSIVRNDITKMKCDAIVNAANRTLLGGGGVDGAIHRVAGKKLLKECRTLGGCETGEAKITGAYDLASKYVIHTVGPIWSGGNRNEENLLRSCYRNSLRLAKEYKCESVAFPLISSGAYGYPKADALRIAQEEIQKFLSFNEMTVYLVVYDKSSFQLSKGLAEKIEEYINEQYVELHPYLRNNHNGESMVLPQVRYDECGIHSALDEAQEVPENGSCKYAEIPPVHGHKLHLSRKPAAKGKPESSLKSLTDILGNLDESFSEMLLRKIDESGMTDAECYKKANIDRKLFSKIRSDRLYKPSKQTAIAFAIALNLSLEETKDMLMKAGFALSHSSKFDIIIEFFIKSGNYNIYEINEALFAFDQVLLV